MASLCRTVPILCAFALGLGGCMLSHQAGGEEPFCGPPPGMRCCSPSGAPVEAGVGCPFSCPTGSALTPVAECRPTTPPDAGRPPPPRRDAGPEPSCPERRGRATCLESFAVLPDAPFELPVTLDHCVCTAETSCTVEVSDDPAHPVLRLTTTLCPDDADCDQCLTAEALRRSRAS